MKLVSVLMLLGTMFALSTSPASAWWQFVANGPNSERQVSPRFPTEKECKSALKVTESTLGGRADMKQLLTFGCAVALAFAMMSFTQVVKSPSGLTVVKGGAALAADLGPPPPPPPVGKGKAPVYGKGKAPIVVRG